MDQNTSSLNNKGTGTNSTTTVYGNGKTGQKPYKEFKSNKSTGQKNAKNKNNESGNSHFSNKQGNSFKGAIKEMNGHVFQLYSEATHKNQFTRTIDELSRYVGLHFKKYPADIKRMITTLTETIFEEPQDIEDGATKVRKRIWEAKVDLYAAQESAYITNKCAL